ncbi:MAG: hypothetical protein NW241_21820 [Bacteroidia bacterium]|nr:hypothetical protein [Bacteroidia bacterium]
MRTAHTAGLLALLLLLASALHQAAAQPSWPAEGISLHASINGVVAPFVLNYERYLHREVFHFGLGLGAFFAPTLIDDSIWPSTAGPHATASIWLGRASSHLELKLGAGFGYIVSNVRGPGRFPKWKAIPVATLGYRYQAPGEPIFFRADLGTGGLGLGVGITPGFWNQ